MNKLINKYTEKMLKSAWENENMHKMLIAATPAYLKAAEYKKSHTKTFKVSVPVVCVGNLTMGGTGKTPFAIKIAQEAIKSGKNPFFLSRGYRGKLQGVIVNRHLKYSAEDVGDEPLLLSKIAPVIINKNRYKGAELAIKNGADMLIMDDGFQNYTLEKDFSFLIFDGKNGIGNGFVLPAGPLRETFDAGLKRANAAVIMREDEKNLNKMIHAVYPDMPVFYADLSFDEKDVEQIKAQKCLVMTAIGNPEKFVTSLQSAGAEITKTEFFPDHHFYTDIELSEICKTANKEKLLVVTTEKDAVKISDKWLKNIKVMPVKIILKDEDNEKIKELLSL